MSKTEVFVLKGMLSEMPVEDQERFKECQAKITAVLAEYGDIGFVALALVALEAQDK
jgi:hypothetical protein